MNFFKLYVGDYQRDTAHLSVTEHGAYLLMLQHYYATEKPLPTGKALHRMLRAQDKAERDAIDAVVQQFWHETPNGLINHRADAEITKAGAQADTNRAIAQAREAKRKAARQEHDKSTNRATNDQPNHSQTPDLIHSVPSEPAIASPTTDREMVFASGVTLLTAAGVSDKNARSFLAAQCKAHGEPAVRDALQRCASEAPIQPVPWLTAVLKSSPAKPRKSDALMAGNIAVAQRFLAGETHD